MDNLEDKFRALEIDDELPKLKQQLRSHSQTGKERNSSQSNKEDNQPKNDPNNCYEILGLKPGVSLKEVKQTYVSLVKKWRPDIFFPNSQLQKNAQKKLKQINKAYE